MQFPDAPTCHVGQWPTPSQPTIWRRRTLRGPLPEGVEAPSPDVDLPYRTCSYCGSMHPEDLLTAIEGGAQVGGSDWKYGWPHKFYIRQIPNPHANTLVVVSSSWGGRDAEGKPLPGPREVKWGPAGLLSSKWYNEHIADEGFDPEAITKLIDALEKHAGISFMIENGHLRWRAPYQGFQR